MGKANKARRAAKRRDHQRRRSQGRPWQAYPPSDRRGDEPTTAECEAMLLAAAHATVHEGPEVTSILLERVLGTPPERVDAALRGLLARTLGAIWNAGWQPADLDRAAQKLVSGAARGLLTAAVLRESQSYGAIGREHAPDWMAQIDALEPSAPSPAVEVGVEALALLLSLSPVPEIGPPPKQWGRAPRRQAAASHGIDERLLARVRALLAKAESTEFEEEATAFTTKAQELMTRHRIDRLLVAEQTGAAAEVTACRITTDDPYASAKAMLLGSVAKANGCRAVWSDRYGFSTVFGQAPDLEAVDVLFTSLLVQATTSMRVAGRDRRTRSRSFRQSFLVGFAHRVYERLHEGVETATATAAAHDVQGCLLPVLARSDEHVEEVMRDAVPGMRSFSVGVRDHAGYAAGVVAGDVADLTAPRLPLP